MLKATGYDGFVGFVSPECFYPGGIRLSGSDDEAFLRRGELLRRRWSEA